MMQEETNLEEMESRVLEEEVIHLHHSARIIEQYIGVGQLSQDVRNCADRLHELLKRY